MSDGGHDGVGEHHQGHVPVPSVPKSCFVVIEPELDRCGLEPFLDAPARAFDLDQRFDRHVFQAPRGEIGQVAITDVSADQQVTGPKPERVGVEIGERAVGPVIEPFSLGAVTCGEASPDVDRQSLGNLSRLTGDGNVRVP